MLGVTAVVLAGSSMSDLGNLVSQRFALFLSVGVYLLIGPLFALPRTGSVSFEIALLPYIGKQNSMLWSLLF
ncbi:branched-chain amino acid transport system II carrier protein, partial [Erysipelatoclostridium ramosum]|uniref:branched-chain amino acid transport system II carrier protein n=1 Tax=Thomasclavelia ramosa TaxID=1547 RepID=UPI001D085F9C|nr:branched-chain amino acid transport system II carrier protein [Thomasclavelia ramosa]